MGNQEQTPLRHSNNQWQEVMPNIIAIKLTKDFSLWIKSASHLEDGIFLFKSYVSFTLNIKIYLSL